ncbi:8-oxo-dGTP pyrophosphatase MutT (NUDIX family) [Devosia sp. UYZn731]|uniref:NUDIX hydrolase n=1 Tax=Devosia sp. UYZn731 TaxID=3156345 RepID=UPI0033963680
MTELAPYSKRLKQVAALPWRLNANGELEILLVTSRISRHWLLPKGWPMDGKSNAQAARQEAFEEAGIEGRISKSRLAKFAYRRIEPDGSTSPCVVSVFALRVSHQLDDWPEQHQRDRQWFALDAAAAVVFVPSLAAMLSLLMVKNDALVLRRVWRPKGGRSRTSTFGSDRSDE